MSIEELLRAVQDFLEETCTHWSVVESLMAEDQLSEIEKRCLLKG